MRISREIIEALCPLSRQAIKKLRDAHEISFHNSPAGSGITARKRKNDAIIDEFEVETRSTFNDFDKRPGKAIELVGVCHYLMWYANNVHELWQTAARFLKPLDRLQLHWTRDGRRNENLRKVEYHADSLKLVVHRPRAGGFNIFVFLIEVQIGPDNTARMIRRGPFNNE